MASGFRQEAAAASTGDADPAGIGERDVTVGGHRLRLYETGTSSLPRVLWLHGAGPGVGALTNWGPILTRLAGRFHNLAPDMPGFADSSHPWPAPTGLAAYTELRARVLLQFLETEDAGPVDVVGNSMGAMVALRMALLDPARLRRIVIHGSPGAVDSARPRAVRVAAFYDNPSLEALTDLLRSFFADPDARGAEIAAMAAERWVTAQREDVRRSHLATFDPGGAPLVFTPEQLGSIPHPVLVVHGREDRLVSLPGSYYFVEHIPDAELHVLPRSGHWVHVERAGRFAALVTEFLSADGAR